MLMKTPGFVSPSALRPASASESGMSAAQAYAAAAHGGAAVHRSHSVSALSPVAKTGPAPVSVAVRPALTRPQSHSVAPAKSATLQVPQTQAQSAVPRSHSQSQLPAG